MYKKWLGLLHASKFSESFGGYRKKIIVLFNLINFKFMKYLVLITLISTFLKRDMITLI